MAAALIGFLIGLGFSAIAASLFIWFKVVPDMEEYEREIKRLKATTS